MSSSSSSPDRPEEPLEPPQPPEPPLYPRSSLRAYKLLDSPERWTQGAFARLDNGLICETHHKDAVCWCVNGAIAWCYPMNNWSIQKKLEDRLKEMGHRNGSVLWNDNPKRKYTEVIAVLKELDI